MRLDPFLSKKSPDPDEVIKSAPAPGRPPGPKVIEVGVDQDCVDRTAESDDPAASFRPGAVTDKKPEHGMLFRPVGKAWSDEARAAALEARRHGASGKRPEGQGVPAAGTTRAHLTALQENAENARREGNKDGAALLMDGAKALAGQALDPKTAARAHALLEEHESDAEKDGNQQLLSAVRAARGALARYAKAPAAGAKLKPLPYFKPGVAAVKPMGGPRGGGSPLPPVATDRISGKPWFPGRPSER